MNGYNPYMHMPAHGQMMSPSYGMMDQPDYQKQVHDQCKNSMLQFVMIEMNDGNTYDGIIEDVDDDYVVLLIPEGDKDWSYRKDSDQNDEDRQFGFGGFSGYGYGGYGYPGYGYGVPRRFRRFRRYRFPFFGIRRLLYPFFF